MKNRNRRLAPIFLLLPFSAAGQVAVQVVCALGPGAAGYKAAADQRPSADALELTARVNAAERAICGSKCPDTVLFRNATASNAMLLAEAGQAKLVYAPQFFTAVYDSYGDAGILAIVAHEFGHALDDAMGAAWIASDLPPELRADSWAGCMLARSGLGAGDVQAALSALAKYPAPAHPAWSLRLAALRNGYTHCGGSGAAFDAAAKPK